MADDGRWWALGAVAAMAAAGAVVSARRGTRNAEPSWTFRVSGTVDTSVEENWTFEEEDVEIVVSDPLFELDEGEAKQEARSEFYRLMEDRPWGDQIDAEKIADQVVVNDVHVSEVVTASRPRRSFRTTFSRQRRRLAGQRQGEED